MSKCLPERDRHEWVHFSPQFKRVTPFCRHCLKFGAKPRGLSIVKVHRRHPTHHG